MGRTALITAIPEVRYAHRCVGEFASCAEILQAIANYTQGYAKDGKECQPL